MTLCYRLSHLLCLALSLTATLTLLPADAAAQCADVEQNTQNDTASLSDSQELGQSFTAPCTGSLLSIKVEVQSITTGPMTGTLRIYDGDGTTGTGLTTESYSFSTVGQHTVTLTTPVPITNTQRYTFFFDVIGGEGNVFFNSADPYAGGNAYGGEEPGNAGSVPPYDLLFTAGIAATLPVELASFTAVRDGADVLLRWSTASETNNAGFEIEHRQRDAWQQTAFTAGHGTTTEPQDYRHRFEGLTPGTHRFRLKQIDYDGAFEYSPEVEVTVEMAHRFVLAPVYPNPFNPAATVRFSVKESLPVRAALYDVLGREVQRLYAGVPAAGETVEARIDGSGLVSGLYLVRLVGQGVMATQTVTLLK